MADLWEDRRTKHRQAAEPLAVRMRPRMLDEFAGQSHFLGPGKLLRRMLEADRITSVLFHGPPGTGKTTLAELIAKHTEAHFDRGNAAVVGVKDVRHVLDGARKRLEQDGRRTLFFLDEIHRFNKAQQDGFLPHMEDGTIVLVGATTENPSFELNAAVLSRAQVLVLNRLTSDDLAGLLARAEEETGKLPLDPAAREALLNMAD
ncbi:MAG: AAA family ATPase, partial [Planctomycetota bacterium]